MGGDQSWRCCRRREGKRRESSQLGPIMLLKGHVLHNVKSSDGAVARA